MMSDVYYQNQQNFLRALHTSNWNDVVFWATELLKVKEDEAMVWANRGVALSKMGFYLDAILNYDRAILLENSAISHSNKGAAYWDMYNNKKARESLYRAIEIEPLAQTYMTLGNVYKYEGALSTAIGHYRSSVATDPEYADGHLVLGMALLKAQQFEEGWKEYEWRWKSDQLPPRKLKCPTWSGENLNGKTILVYGEQGLGDMIQFARYAARLAAKYPKAKVIIEGRPPIKRLLETIPEIYAVINAGEKLPALDYGISMISLAAMFTPNIDAIIADKQSIPAREFFPKQSDSQAWANRFTELPPGLKVGVCWAGMSRDSMPSAAAIDALRSTTLEQFAPLAKIPGIIWVSLQKGPPSAQVKTPPVGMQIADYTEELYDFYDTACVMENCDLIITVDTAVVHAAASLGKPTWMLSRWDGCWRWFGDRSDSPWYPTLRQFVQHGPREWGGVMEDVAKELAKLIPSKNT
jgi:tetratricopeptide (TPR) repeat protein